VSRISVFFNNRVDLTKYKLNLTQETGRSIDSENDFENSIVLCQPRLTGSCGYNDGLVIIMSAYDMLKHNHKLQALCIVYLKTTNSTCRISEANEK